MIVRFMSKLRVRLTNVAVATALGIVGLNAEVVLEVGVLPVRVHPQVFSLIQGWNADTGSPVVTEINLGVVEQNRNQFSKTHLKQEGDWTIFRDPDSNGFKRYRLIGNKGNSYKLEYQENGGGTLTSSAMIEFTLVNREIVRKGKLETIQVLRVNGCDTN